MANQNQIPETETAEPSPVPIWLKATADDARLVDIEAPLAGLTEADCDAFSDLYRKAAETHKDQSGRSNTAEARVYATLSAITGMYFKPAQRQEPFVPMVEWADGRRSAKPADFRSFVGVLAILADKAVNPTMKARLSDLCWLVDRKQAKYGFVATLSYVEIVRLMDAGDLKHRLHNENGALHYQGHNALLRALHIGHSLGDDKPETVAARALAKTLRKKCLNAGALVEVHRFSSLDLDYRISDAVEVGEGIEGAIARFKAEGDNHTAVELWRLAARAYGLAKKEDDRFRCLNEAAETLVSQAEASTGSATLAAHFLGLAIAQLGRVHGKRERRTALRHKLVDVQAGVVDELSTFSHELDLSDIAKGVQERISKATLLDSLFIFASLSRSPDPAKLRTDAMDAINEHPLSSLFDTAHLDREGKVIHRTQGGGLVHEEAIHNQIAQTESIRRQIVAMGSIEAARATINAKHHVDDDLLAPVLQHSPFVPDHLIRTFSRGFSRLFQGDFISATYILTPLLENSLRHVLKGAGHDVSIFDDVAQTQQDRTISSLFEQMRAELDGILDIAITAEIERLFLQKPGPHLRHALSHGLLSDGDPFGSDAIYGCWLIFHLCLLPLFSHRQQLAEWLKGTDLVRS